MLHAYILVVMGKRNEKTLLYHLLNLFYQLNYCNPDNYSQFYDFPQDKVQ